MKRLLCIITALDAGGAETFLMKVFRVLPEEYKLDFIVFRPDGVYEDEVLSRGGKIYNIPKHSEHPIKALRMVEKIIKENRYQNVLKLADTPVGVFDVIAAKKAGATNVSVRACNAASDMGTLKGVICSILRPALNICTDTKIAPSELAGRFVFGHREFNKGNVHLLHNGVDLKEYGYDTEKRADLRKKYNINDKLVIGNVGRFTTQKNHEFLLDVFKQIIKIEPESVLLLVGNGEKTEEIKDKARKLEMESRIIFAGLQFDVAAFYSAMDVYVHTAFYEGMPNTIIEAQATSLPCVISDTITREANITGLVDYLPLTQPEKWAEMVCSRTVSKRETPFEIFKEKGYDIESVKTHFINLLF